MNKKPFMKRYQHLIGLALITLLAVALNQLHVMPLAGMIFLVCGYQLIQFALSRPRRGVCYNSVLTPEQLQEFQDILKSFGSYGEMFKLLKGITDQEGGWAAIKQLPELLKGEQKKVDELNGELKKLRKQAQQFRGHTGVRWVGNVPFVTDDCARAMTSMFVLETAELGPKAMRQLNREERSHEGLIAQAREYLGMEAKTAMTGTEIPLPTIYVPQIIELVFAYGAARQYATVFPLGAGTVKLPRLKAGEDDFGYLGVGTAGMSAAVTERRVAAELVTFTANKAGGLIRLPTELEEDTFIPIGQFLARYIGRQLAKLEDKTMFIGDGTATYANQTGVGPYCVANPTYLKVLAAGKTKPSDATLADFRAIRPLVSAAVLSNMAANGQTAAAYYMHPTLEALLVTFNTLNNPNIYQRAIGGQPATLDGFPIHWIGVSQAYVTTAQISTYLAFFGDLSYWYLGERGAPRVEVSRDVFFATDELAMRALERIDVEALAIDAMAALQTAAA
ncbi:MAG: Phage capsid family protein [Pedosphaera sp.]|nr:Phage capsid family protein [Pedosphaera sp.]